MDLISHGVAVVGAVQDIGAKKRRRRERSDVFTNYTIKITARIRDITLIIIL
jgi:hypothetical protein